MNPRAAASPPAESFPQPIERQHSGAIFLHIQHSLRVDEHFGKHGRSVVIWRCRFISTFGTVWVLNGTLYGNIDIRLLYLCYILRLQPTHFGKTLTFQTLHFPSSDTVRGSRVNTLGNVDIRLIYQGVLFFFLTPTPDTVWELDENFGETLIFGRHIFSFPSDTVW